MKTVKEVSKLTGISARTLHYYDEIGLLRPAQCTEAGYRLYDDKAMERLKQILFFREFEIPLKEIRTIMDAPDFDRDKILKMQKIMLEKKRDRLNRLIDSIERMLEGANDMEFEIFAKDELEEMYQAMVANMSEEQKNALCREHGSLEKYHEEFLRNAGSEQAQKNFQKVVEWYGDKESAVKAASNPNNPEIFAAYQNRLSDIMKRLAEKRGADVNTFEIKALAGEYDFVTKQLYQLPDAEKMILELAELYEKDKKIRAALDEQYGEGTAAYMAEVFRAFYRKQL